ncbi:MAG: ParB/RepB/Spo0J family partition protein [Pseudomonadota bacterium]|nr:ParB/RepB/Spo0J family partition protein [Pseudomonadota bacterium]
MELSHIEFTKLKISKTNMRYRDPPPDVSDILPSIRAKGVLEPLLVRPEDGKYGVVAGRRRYFALKDLKQELGEIEPPPCAIMAEGDDAEAIEASLLENVARRDPDPMREYETFVRLIKEGRTVDGIAATFGMTATQVKQRLALGNLLPKIRNAYRAEEIDDETARHLTLASPAQQRKWLRLYSDPQQCVPRGYQLKQWLFGGQQIATGHALFKLSDYTGQIIEDLFGEERYFADADLFWVLQNRAIAAKQDALMKAGWSAVEILEPGQRFSPWEHVKTSKKKGGKVFIAVSPDGAVEVQEGWLTQKEAKKRAKAEVRATDNGGDAKVGSTSSGPTMTKAMENYLDLHRQALARRALIGTPQVAWRLAVAHMLAPSGNWSVDADDGQSRSVAITASVERSPAQAAFREEEQAVQALLGWDGDDICRGTASIFAKLLTLGDAEVQRVAAYVMALSLKSGNAVVDAVGEHLAIDPRGQWQADDCFFDLMRDRATINAVLAEVAGAAVAKGNVAEKAKTQKQIVHDCLAGANGRTKVEGWVPGWLCFPSRQIGAPAPSADVFEDRAVA